MLLLDLTIYVGLLWPRPGAADSASWGRQHSAQSNARERMQHQFKKRDSRHMRREVDVSRQPLDQKASNMELEVDGASTNDAALTDQEHVGLTRRRRTAGLYWDCDFLANWLNNTHLPTYVFNLGDTTGENIQSGRDRWCKDHCMESVVPCTGFYIMEYGIIPGSGDWECGLYTTDMNQGDKATQLNTSDGALCLRVGKNFECDFTKSTITADTGPGFTAMRVPKEKEHIKEASQALEYCKFQCNEPHIQCKTLYFQQNLETTSTGSRIEWECGFFTQPQDKSTWSENGAPTQHGAVCTAV
mmetsp:Transcript_95243/g.168639  ORF Transcript_95243/g.168639 Transcript_95243/m.168639 type:complete len:301 (-) Transcript_95243:8-910(-)